jgi:hypothetical protein
VADGAKTLSATMLERLLRIEILPEARDGRLTARNIDLKTSMDSTSK